MKKKFVNIAKQVAVKAKMDRTKLRAAAIAEAQAKRKARKLEGLKKKFGKDNVLTLPLSVFKINANKAFDDICDFLKVEKFLTYPDTSSRHNKTAIPFYRIPENQTINQSTLSYKAFNIAYQLSKKIRLDHFFLKDTPPTPDSVKKILENALSKEKSWLENLEKSF